MENQKIIVLVNELKDIRDAYDAHNLNMEKLETYLRLEIGHDKTGEQKDLNKAHELINELFRFVIISKTNQVKVEAENL